MVSLLIVVLLMLLIPSRGHRDLEKREGIERYNLSGSRCIILNDDSSMRMTGVLPKHEYKCM